MTLSKDTIAKLKNLASINLNLEIKEGEPALKTISEAKTILASVELEEAFPQSFGIYNLSEFIAVHDLLGSPELTFKKDRVVFKNTSTNTVASFRYADVSTLTVPLKEVNMPPADITVNITETILGQARKAASVLGHTTVSINTDGDDVLLTVKDPSSPTANNFSIVVADNDSGAEFDFQILIDNIKVLPGDYSVHISSKLVSKWENTASKANYFIALEKTSTYSK